MKVKNFAEEMREKGFTDEYIEKMLVGDKKKPIKNIFDFEEIKKAKRLAIKTVDGEYVKIEMDNVRSIDELHIEYEKKIQYGDEKLRKVISIPFDKVVTFVSYYPE